MQRSIELFLTKPKVSGKRVSKPTAPYSAWLKGNLLASWSCGVWSDTIASIVPSFIPSIIDTLSSSVLRGGESLEKVL